MTSTSATAIALSWTGAPGVTIQVARESYCGTEGYVTLATLAAGATSYTDNTVQADWVYWYEITATDPTTGMTASAAIATQADAMPTHTCSGGATPRASGASAEACTGAGDGGTPITTDSGVTINDGGGDAPIINGNPCPIAAGASQSTIQSTLNSCGSGNTAVFAAGTYGPITSTITIPCGVSMSGPTVPYSQTPNQTATINASSGFIGWGFQTTPGCSASQAIQYLAWDGKLPSNGGGFLNIVPGTTNLTVQNNWFHGVNAPGASTGSQYNQADLIFFNGNSSSATTSNVLIQWNVFGSNSFADCAGAMNDTSGEENDNGGGCGGIGIHDNVANVTITNNILHWLEEPIKTYESPSSGSCNGLTINYNSVTNYSRIGYETQCYTPGPTLMYIQYNNWGTRYGSQQTYDVSAANGCGSGYGSTCETHTDYNVDLQAATGAADVGLEIWGQGPEGCTTHCTTANYNLLQGYLYNAITWSVAGNFQFNNNTFNIVKSGTNTDCTVGSGGFWDKEGGNNPAFSPTCTGNTFSNAITGTTASTAPSISPASGTFSGSQVVAITNPGTNRDTNTTDWCTTDGSTPTPGSGTAVGYYKGRTLTVTKSTTVKCVGMWGALNQPYSYPSGYAYVPSTAMSATYTAQ